MNLSNRIFGTNVNSKIREYFDDLQKGTFEIKPGEPISSHSDTGTYLGDRIPYARMWTAVNVSDSGSLDAGQNFVYVINDNKNESYNELDSILGAQYGKSQTNYKDQLSKNPYLKPIAGIKNINSKSEGAVGALRRTTVDFVVHNKHDFETIFLPFFLKPSSTIFVDFGWSDKALTLYDPIEFIKNSNVEMSDFYKTIFKDDGDVETGIGRGFKTTLSGQVVKYDVNVDDKGSFNCNLEFVSSNYALLDKSISEDNTLKFIFNNAIEELVMGYFLKSSDIDATEIIDYEAVSKLSSEKRQELVKEFFDGDVANKSTGLINDTAKKLGIFYQNLSDTSDDADKLDQKESLYISYGFFEDKFLNKFISLWEFKDDDGKVIDQPKSDKPFINSFSNINSFVRYDENLEKLQFLKYQDADDRLSYLYPDTWDVDETYNKLKPDIKNKKGDLLWKDTRDDKNKRRIPLRELFIAVPVISDAFRKSTNVNDALEFIFDQVYEDSGNILNIKMMANNKAQTSIAFYDVNVESDKFETANEKILTFDLTSGNSVVLNSDLKFETPKAGLSSMIAIGNLSEPTVFDQTELMKYNFLNAIQSEAKKQVKHLPIYGEAPLKSKALKLDLGKMLKSGNTTDNINDDFFGGDESNVKDRLATFIEERNKAIKEEDKKPTAEKNKQEDSVEDPLPTKNEDGDQILYAISERNFEMLTAKVNNFIKSNSNSISPVLPITLSLKIYGNNFLSIGDFFTVNFLPSHYQDRVYFQIVGVDHTVGTGMWETTYTTVMRLKATQKYRSFRNKDDKEKSVVIKYHPTLKKHIVNELITKQQGSLKNLAVPHMITDVTHLETVKTENNFKLPPGITNDDIPGLLVSSKQVILDPNKPSEDFDKLKKENKMISTEKIPTQVSIPSIFDAGSLAYYMSISSLLLGDEVIDWEALTADNEPKSQPQFYIKSPTSKSAKSGQLNGVNVIPRSKGGDLTKRYKDFIMEGLDSYVDSWHETDIGLDPFQTKLDYQISVSKQTLSPHIRGIMGGLSGFHFLDSIIWRIPQNEPTKFININITGHKDVDVFSSIFIPQAYLKLTNMKVFADKLRKKYVGQKAGLNTYFKEIGLENE